MTFLFQLRPQQLTTDQRTGVDSNTAWGPTGDNGCIPNGTVIIDSDRDQVFLGDGTPENNPDTTTSTVGGRLVGPELGGGWKTITSTATGTQNDFNPTDWNIAQHLLLNPASAVTITGLLAPTGWTPAPGTAEGHVKFITNISSTIQPAFLAGSLAGSTSSADANEILMPATYYLPTNDTIIVRYDTTVSRWRLIGTTKSTKHFHSDPKDGGEILQAITHQVRNATTLTTLKMFTKQAITVVEAKSTRRGGTSTTWNLRYGTDPTAAGTKVWTSDIVTSTSGGVQTDGSPNNPNIPADNFVWMDVVSAVGPPTETLMQVRYTIDYV